MLKSGRVCDLHEHVECAAGPAYFGGRSTDGLNEMCRAVIGSASALVATLLHSQAERRVRSTIRVLLENNL